MKRILTLPGVIFLLPVLLMTACKPAPALQPAVTLEATQASHLAQEPVTPTEGPREQTPVVTAPPTEETPAPQAPSGEEMAVVAYVQEGGIHLWREGTGQVKTIFDEGGAQIVTVSDDGELIAFTRAWFDFDLCYQMALWVVDREGENAREILSPEALSATLGDADCEYPFVTFARVEWLPKTHRLLYSVIWDAPHAPPQGLYLADADMLTVSELVSIDHNIRSVPSPDGLQIALLSATELGFIHADGSNWRPAVLTFPRTGIPVSLLPNGVWSQDSRSFLIVAPTLSDSEFVLNYDILHVPLDGSPPEALAAFTNSHGDSVTFSPDGQRASFWQDGEPWRRHILALAPEPGPLDIPYAVDLGTIANLHWSPAGTAYVVREGNLLQLCPDASQDDRVCGDPIPLDSRVIASIQWIDKARFLFMTRDPYTLFLARLDGTKQAVVTWGPEDRSQSFSPYLVLR